MNLDLTPEQEALRDTFARFFTRESSTDRVRAHLDTGFDPALWTGLAGLGAFLLRVPEEKDGLGLGTFEAVLLMEEAGRTLASAPLAEAIVSARLLAQFDGEAAAALLARLAAGEAVVTLAYHDVAAQPVQWVAGGAVAEAVLARRGDEVLLLTPKPDERVGEPNLASTSLAELRLDRIDATVLGKGAAPARAFAQAIEEWKLLIAAALSGLSRQALKLAAEYASQRSQFGQLIGTFQGVSHPLADLLTHVEGGKLLIWQTLRHAADGDPQAEAEVSLAAWWNATTASRAVGRALHTFGGYGLTVDYDVHLFNLRAKAWPLVFGDPAGWLEEAGRRLYAGERADLQDVGEVSIEFGYGAEADALAAEIDAFFVKNLTPELKAKSHYSFAGHDPGLHKKLAEAGLLFPSWPEDYGGRNASPYADTAANEVWGDHDWTLHVKGTVGMVGAVLQRFASPEVKQDALAKIAAGDAICSLGFSEPSSGSDVFAAKTRATPDNGGWRIDGQKMFTSGANITDYILLLARTDQDAPKHRGLTAFLVPVKSKGLDVQAVHTFQDERTNITFYDGVWIPDSYRLGEVNGGAQVLAASLSMEHNASFAGTQLRMLRAAERLCREIQRGGQPLIEETSTQMRLARVAADTAMSELLGRRAIWAAVEGKPNFAFGPMVKLFSSEMFVQDSSDLLDLTAPLSLSKRSGDALFLNQCYRHAQGTTIYGGTSEIHRSMVAERALGMPRTRLA